MVFLLMDGARFDGEGTDDFEDLKSELLV